jgi:hypothetical protein
MVTDNDRTSTGDRDKPIFRNVVRPLVEAKYNAFIAVPDH